MRKIITLTALLFFSAAVLGQDFKIINTSALNIREQPGKNYEIVGQALQGEKVSVLSQSGEWTKIKTGSGIEGFVATKYLISASPEKDNEKQDSEPIGFKYGFKKAFPPIFVISVFIFAAFDYFGSKRIKDARYNKGYKEIPFTQLELLKYAIYSTIISTIISLFSGIFYWIKSF